VESCTALVEHFDGRLAIVTWAESSSPPEAIEMPAEVPEPVGANFGRGHAESGSLRLQHTLLYGGNHHGSEGEGDRDGCKIRS
jgi:hypothetical protein